MIPKTCLTSSLSRMDQPSLCRCLHRPTQEREEAEPTVFTLEIFASSPYGSIGGDPGPLPIVVLRIYSRPARNSQPNRPAIDGISTPTRPSWMSLLERWVSRRMFAAMVKPMRGFGKNRSTSYYVTAPLAYFLHQPFRPVVMKK